MIHHKESERMSKKKQNIALDFDIDGDVRTGSLGIPWSTRCMMNAFVQQKIYPMHWYIFMYWYLHRALLCNVEHMITSQNPWQTGAGDSSFSYISSEQTCLSALHICWILKLYGLDQKNLSGLTGWFWNNCLVLWPTSNLSVISQSYCYVSIAELLTCRAFWQI